MKRFAIFCLLLSCISSIWANNFNNRETVLLLKELKYLASEQKTLFGQYDTYYSGHNWLMGSNDFSFTKCDVFDICGDYPAIFGFDFNGIMQTANYQAAIKHHKRGGIITISWHMNNVVTGGNAWDCSSDKVVRGILSDEEIKQVFCKKLDSFASFCKMLKDENGDCIPILFRPWHESTSNYFWWGTKCCSDRDFKSLWKFTYNYLVKEKNVSNLIWVYSLDKTKTERDFKRRYPGNKYVDIIGFEKYQYWTEVETEIESLQRFRTEFEEGIALLSKFCRKHNKIPAVTELGFAGGVPNCFWTYCVENIINDYQLAYFFVWSNSYENSNYVYGPFFNSSDSADFLKMVDNGRVLLLNGFSNIKKYK